jgi:hypothetical protein
MLMSPALLTTPVISSATALAASFVMIWPGYAILHLAGLGRDRWPAALFAGPAMTCALWILVLSTAAWASCPLHMIAALVWTVTLIATIIGIAFAMWSRRKAGGAEREAAGLFRLWGAAIVLALVIMPATLRYGLGEFANSTTPDSWSYAAVADYLFKLPRGAEGGLHPLDQYASHLMNVRNASSAILAQLSEGFGVTADQTMALYCLLLLFANGAALAAFALTVFESTELALCLMVLAGLGWPANIIFAGNLDQLLLLPLLPVTAAISCRAGSGLRLLSAAVLIGMLCAAAFVAYVELAFIGMAVALAFVVVPDTPLRLSLLRLPIVACAAAIVFLILTWPDLTPLMAMLKHQYASTAPGTRPGEGFFPGLVAILRLPDAFWALGGEYGKIIGAPLRWLLGAILLAATLTGVRLERRRWLAVLALATVTAGYFYLTLEETYSYGAYKLLSVNFWMICFFTVPGGIFLARRAADLFPRIVTTRAAVAVVLFIVFLDRTAVQAGVVHYAANTRQQRQLREATAIASMTNGAATLLTVRDDLANRWAVFYLSDVPLLISPYRSYMAQAHVIPYMERAKVIDPSTIRYIVTDRDDSEAALVTGATRIFNGEIYSLWQVRDAMWSVIADAKGSNGTKDRGLLLSSAENADLLTVSGQAHPARLTGTAEPTAGSSQVAPLQVVLQDAAGPHQLTLAPGKIDVPVVVAAGRGSIGLAVAEKPDEQSRSGSPQATRLRLIGCRLERTKSSDD